MSAWPLLSVLWLLSQNAQAPAPSLSFDGLKTTLQAPAVPASSNIQELTLNWNAFAAPAGALVAGSAAPAPINTFEVTGRRVTAGPMPLDRNPELSADQLVVIGADANGSRVSWSLIKDPRLVRSEQSGPDGSLSGTLLYRASTQLTVVLPDVPQVVQVAIYQPRWTGSAWALDLIGSFSIPQSR